MNSVFHPLHPRPGSAGKPMPGMDVRVVNDEGVEVEVGELGNIVLKPVSNSVSFIFKISLVHIFFCTSPLVPQRYPVYGRTRNDIKSK